MPQLFTAPCADALEHLRELRKPPRDGRLAGTRIVSARTFRIVFQPGELLQGVDSPAHAQ
jgi:hypothetical protein